MTNIYNDSNVYCSSFASCSNNDPSQIDTNEVFPLADLYYCPSCHCPKSKYQCSYEIVSKYCSNCLIEHHDIKSPMTTHCPKNCFDCPSCRVILTISMNNHPERNGKSFSFKCKYCRFNYTTEVIEKPKSLLSIINQELQIDQDYHARLYEDIKAQALSSHHRKDQPLDDMKVRNLNLSTMTKPVPSKQSLFEIDTQSDNIAQRLIENKFHRVANQYHQTSNQWHENQHKFPLPKPLSIKYSLTCHNCNTAVLLPKVVTNQPTLFKFAIKSYAKDYLPIVKLIKFNRYKNIYLLNFINPLPSKCSVTLSAPSEIPPKFIVTSSMKESIKVQLTLPINKFVIGANLNKNVIKNIPTSILTKHTSASLAELITRNKVDQLDSYQQQRVNDSEEEELDFSQLVDKGSNWYTVPIHLLQITQLSNSNPGNAKTIQLTIPVFINVKSYQNKEITAINDTNANNEVNVKGNTPQFETGYWNLIDVTL